MSVPPPPPRRRDAPTFVAPDPPPIDPEARAARRAEERNGGDRRWVWIVASVLVVILIAGGAALALSGGGGDSSSNVKASTTVDLKAGALKIESVSVFPPLPKEFPTDVRDKVLKTIGTYIDKGIVASLRTSKADDAGLAPAFDAGAAAKLTGPDRAVLLDEGLPKAVGNLKVTTPPVPLTALSAADGNVQLVAADIKLEITAHAASGLVKISRSGTLVFALQLSGDWRITGWTLHIDRSGPGLPSAPTSTTPTT